MENNYILYVGMDISKGKADAAILKVSDRRSVKPKFIRKKLSFMFVKSEVASFLETVRSYSDVNCTSICFALEVTGIYSTNVYNYIKANLYENESIKFLNTVLSINGVMLIILLNLILWMLKLFLLSLALILMFNMSMTTFLKIKRISRFESFSTQTLSDQKNLFSRNQPPHRPM